MTEALDLQRKVQHVRVILHDRQHEVAVLRNSNRQLAASLQKSEAEEADMNTRLLNVRLAAAQLAVDLNSAKSRAPERGEQARIAEDVAGLKSRLTFQRERREKMRLRCQREKDRMAYFRQLIQQKMCVEHSQGTVELLNQVNDRIRQQQQELAMLDFTKETEELTRELDQKQCHLNLCKRKLEEVKEAREVSQQRLQAARKQAQELHEQQVYLNDCRQQLQQLAHDCDQATRRLAEAKGAHVQSTALLRRIAEAKNSIAQLIG